MKKTDQNRNGSAIITVFLVIIILSLTIGGTLIVLNNEYRATRASTSWSQTIHTAEAGVEFAMQAFHQQLISYDGWSSWTHQSADVYLLPYTNFMPSGHSAMDSEFMVQADTNALTILANGYMDPARLPDANIRKVYVEIVPRIWNPFIYSILAKGDILHNADSFVDSFDSSDPSKSTDGEFDPAKRQTNATIATISTDVDTVVALGNGTIYGDLATGSNGTVNIGGSYTCIGGTDDDIDEDIDDVIVPFPTNPVSPEIRINANPQSQTINVNGGTNDMCIDSILVNGGSLTLSGHGTLRVYVENDFSISGSGSLILTNNPSSSNLKVEFYTNGDVLLNSCMNASGNAANFGIYGTPNCESVQCTGPDEFSCTVYAPQADFTFSGLVDFTGAVVADTVSLQGTGDFHYDEALANLKVPYISGYDVKIWQEL
jgi:hypothetical protein